METIQLLGSATGLGLMSGMNLYAAILTVGLGLRMGLIELRPELHQLEILANPYVLLLAGTIFLIEFLADKIKWVDSLWDAIHTFIRPVGAAIIGATAVGTATPQTLIVALLCGGVALSGHSAKAGLRLVANHSPEPVSNVVLSLIEDVLVVLGSWLAMQHPVLMLVVVVLFVGTFVWFTPKVFRLIRVEFVAIVSIIKKLCVVITQYVARTTKRFFRRRKAADMRGEDLSPARDPNYFQNDEMPVSYKYFVKDKFALKDEHPRIRCVAGKGMRGLRHSIGYLHLTPRELIFVTRRFFRFRTHDILRPLIRDVHFTKNLLMDRLSFRVNQKSYAFYFFKDAAGRPELVDTIVRASSKVGA